MGLWLEDVMRQVRICILLAGLGSVGWILWPAAFPFHKGHAYPLSENAVSVYIPMADGTGPLLPVLNISGTKIVATGAKVSVYLNHEYTDALFVPTAQSAVTAVVVALICFLLTFIAEWFFLMRRKHLKS